jgi:hypothetical protein
MHCLGSTDLQPKKSACTKGECVNSCKIAKWWIHRYLHYLCIWQKSGQIDDFRPKTTWVNISLQMVRSRWLRMKRKIPFVNKRETLRMQNLQQNQFLTKLV